MTQDDQNAYLHDAEGRVCAVHDFLNGQMTEYLYDAEGNRVAKGTITSWSCDTTQNGFVVTRSYILDPGGQQLTEMTWSGGVAQFAATNVRAAGKLIASYTPNGSQVALNFQLRDWLGTLRAQTDYAGNVQEKCDSLPYGNGETCVATTPYLFTQHERDAESGNDYFKYRYYASSMGRWLSPDPSKLTYADLENPQSLNLYDYVGNKPLTLTDLEGLCWKGFSWACMDWNRLKDAAVAFMGGFPGNPAAQQQTFTCSGYCLQVESKHPGTDGGGGCSSNPMCEMAYRTLYTRPTFQYLWHRRGPVLTVGANATSVYGIAAHNLKIGLVGSGLGIANHPDPAEIGLIGGSLVPGVDEAAVALGAAYDGGKAVGNWITNNIMAPMLEAIPGPIIGVTADGQEVMEPDISDPEEWDGTN